MIAAVSHPAYACPICHGARWIADPLGDLDAVPCSCTQPTEEPMDDTHLAMFRSGLERAAVRVEELAHDAEVRFLRAREQGRTEASLYEMAALHALRYAVGRIYAEAREANP